MTSWPTSSRLVIDSNVWISAVVFGGAPRNVIRLAIRRGHILLISDTILVEVRRNLQRKFPDYLEDFEALVAALGERLQSVTLGGITVEASRDPDDNRVLETAVLGLANCIVTGDKDLLELKTYENIAIMSASAFAGQA